VVFTGNITDAKYAQPQLLIRDYIVPAITAAKEAHVEGSRCGAF
jgi:hypothetical protein